MAADEEEPGASIVGPSGQEYRLAPESLPPLERAAANRDVTRAYLRDLIVGVQRRYPPALFPIQLVGALGDALRSLPAPWLREFAYAGMLAVLQELEQEPDEGTSPDC